LIYFIHSSEEFLSPSSEATKIINFCISISLKMHSNLGDKKHTLDSVVYWLTLETKIQTFLKLKLKKPFYDTE
jgi:hypothetical protein